VVNLISRRPPDTNDVVVNQTARGGSDVVAFGTTQGRTSTRLSVIGGLHSQRLSDPYHDGWATLPGYRRAEIRPRLYWSDSTGRALFVTVGGTTEKRGGGSVGTFGPAGGVFPESLTTAHGDIGATGRFPLNESLSFAMRVSADIDGRHRQFGNARESERRSTAFSEVTSTLVGGSNVLLGGVALQHDSYRNADAPSFDDGVTTPAVFVQHTYTPSSWFATQVNGRCDASSRWGTICTPRLSLLAHAGRVVSARLSGGSGWYGPAALYEDTEEIGLTRLSATSFFALSPERARTASLDLSTAQGPFEVSGTLFASSIKNAVGLRSLAPGSTPSLAFWNAPGPTQAHGGEVFAVYNQEPVAVTAYYAATRTREISPETGALRETPLVPRETAGLDVAFQEDESGTRVGVELFYSGRQALEDNPYRAISRPYTTVGLLAAKIIGRAQLYVNADNLTNVRQTRFDPLLRSRPDERGRWTVEEWAPLEGRSLNVGVRVRY
jgi:outer membrane receptor for ferrienterochelin and colicins